MGAGCSVIKAGDEDMAIGDKATMRPAVPGNQTVPGPEMWVIREFLKVWKAICNWHKKRQPQWQEPVDKLPDIICDIPRCSAGPLIGEMLFDQAQRAHEDTVAPPN